MKKYFLILLSLVLLACSSQQINDVINATLSQGGALTTSEIGSGLKEALTVGLSSSVGRTSMTNGFLKNPLIKIPFPKEALIVKNTLDKVGLGSLNNKVVTSLNRAAEDASTAAKPIFMAAITKLTFSDIMKIFNGPNNAATEYLKRATTSELITAFKPSIAKSLQKVHATQYWGEVMGKYNSIPFMKKINPDLKSYVTNQAISGLFKEIAKEEGKIRTNPAARTTALLKRVFGSKE